MSKLAELRKAAGLTQAQLAEKSGVHPMRVSKIERGAVASCNITLGTAAALAKVLGVHAEDLL